MARFLRLAGRRYDRFSASDPELSSRRGIAAESPRNRMSKLNEQFDVLSNALRVMPEELLRLNYFIREIREPEEGISNVELACVNIFHSIYGMISAIKEEGATKSIYEHDAISTALCIRHMLAHQSGRRKNNLRDAWSRSIPASPTLIQYNVSAPAMPDTPLYINVAWFQDGIARTPKISRKLAAINAFWKFDTIKQDGRGFAPQQLGLSIRLRHGTDY